MEGPSARVIGLTAVATMIFVGSFIVFLDMITFGKDIQAIKKNCHFIKRLLHTYRRKYASGQFDDANVCKMSSDFKAVDVGFDHKQMRLVDLE